MAILVRASVYSNCFCFFVPPSVSFDCFIAISLFSALRESMLFLPMPDGRYLGTVPRQAR